MAVMSSLLTFGGVDALALEADIDAQFLQLPHCLQTVLLCSRDEAGDGF